MARAYAGATRARVMRMHPASWAVPYAVVAAGAWIAAQAGVPLRAFAPNLVACILGSLACVALRGGSFSRLRFAMGGALLGILLVAFSLLSPGDDGVHRWLALGPVHLHASSVVMPWLVACSAVFASRTLTALLWTATVMALHVAQPDAGQATVFAVASIALMALERPKKALMPMTAGLSLLGVACAWLRPDPLQPVDHVERIVVLAFAEGRVVGIAAVLLLVLLVVSVLMPTRSASKPSALRVALALAMATSMLVSCVGHFPVPILGAGAGPVLGFYGSLIVAEVAEENAVRGSGVRG